MTDQVKLAPYQGRQDALQQISRKADTVRNRLAAMEDIRESAGTFYAALDDEQTLTANQMLISTVPALYAGLADSGGGSTERKGARDGKRGGPGGGMGGPGGGLQA